MSTKLILPLCAALALGSCKSGGSSSASGASGGGGETVSATPDWIANPPKHGIVLSFVGDMVGAPDEGMARQGAQQKALSELQNYVGANVISDSKFVEGETNGQQSVSVEVSVSVAGEQFVVEQAVVKKSVVMKTEDGRWNGYALIEWPRAQYEKILVIQRNKGKRALELTVSAKEAFDARDVSKAQDDLREAKKVLGDLRNVVPLDHPTYRDTALLKTGMTELDAQMASFEEGRKRLCAVGVRCIKEGAPTSCRASRLGVFREAVVTAGRKVSADVLNEATLKAILESDSPQLDKRMKSTGCIVAVQLTADFLEKTSNFTFVKYGARGVLFDTASGRIVASHEVAPTKVGHLDFDKAMEKGFDTAERELSKMLAAELQPAPGSNP